MVGVTDPLVFAPAVVPTATGDDATGQQEPDTDAHGTTPDDRGAGGAHGDALQDAVDAVDSAADEH
jgi:hypothetical protein